MPGEPVGWGAWTFILPAVNNTANTCEMAQNPAGQLIMCNPAAVPPIQSNGTEPRDSKRQASYNCKAAIATGAIQISCGAFAVILQCILLSNSPWHSVNRVGIGIWGGLLFVVTGVFGLLSAKKRRGMIVTYLVTSIICSTTAGVGILMNSFESAYYYNTAYRTMTILLIVTFCIEMLTGIIASSFGCASRVCCSGSPIIHERVVYMSTPPGPPQAYCSAPGPMASPLHIQRTKQHLEAPRSNRVKDITAT
ncbi:hypothetical protein BSL78_25084 [Apostichopus japonicus]|uniref:Transmembrane protein n=1 Tax=Stichopus japonicus TaxID=307972 RepID=A0A2G8JQT2_STIJA|nr:hypothetical protein BSL78_25084 [Apostichopus japonicus]